MGNRDRVLVLSSILLLLTCGVAAGQAHEPSPSGWVFQGTVLGAGLGIAPDHPVVPVGPDPRFHLKVMIDRWIGEAGPLAAGSVVDFAIHSPTLLLRRVELPPTELDKLAGRVYRFRLTGRLEAQGPVFTMLEAEAANAAPPR
jgi:hypothetical protein